MTAPTFTCAACCGVGIVPIPDEGGSGECPLCGGSGYACATGDLGPTRSEGYRPYYYDPARRHLAIGIGKRQTDYTVAEFKPHGAGRAFYLHKCGTDTLYSCLVNPPREYLCDCAGQSYEASDRANYRAHTEGREVYPTLGCRHLDSLAALLKGGWLDLPEHIPAPLAGDATTDDVEEPEQ